MSDLLDELLGSPAGGAEGFALLYRPERAADEVEILLGEAGSVALLADLTSARPARRVADGPRHDVLALIPFRQIVERGFVCQDDHVPIRTLTVHRQGRVSVAAALRRLPRTPVELRDAGFDLDDNQYEQIVRDVIEQEIGTGEGANFVIHRTFTGELPGFGPEQALAVYRRLLARSQGAYWVFLVCVGDHMVLGASPERHISLDSGTVVMNPISGTYRYPASGPEQAGVARFLSDRKEADELLMVVDEELKMIAGICPDGGVARGPYLKQMARLAHTEYLIEGRTTAGVDEILRRSMFAPTVTGSPLENACRVIARHEPNGRGYYSGVAALIGRDAAGEVALDSAIMIRTAEVHDDRLRLGVGATLVRLSDPAAEAAETRAKAAGLLAAFGAHEDPAGPQEAPVDVARLDTDPEIRRLLAERNRSLARFWLEPRRGDGERHPELAGRRGLIIDAEDTFTAMLACQLEALGARIELRSWREQPDLSDPGYDFAVLGPGPGDPRDLADPKIVALRRMVRRALADDVPFLAVCLSHQVLCGVLGLDLVRRKQPNQGVQLPVQLPWGEELVGFYNTFAGFSPIDRFTLPGLARPVEVFRDRVTGQVHALHGPGFAGVQFHPESVLTEHGSRILGELLAGVMALVPRAVLA